MADPSVEQVLAQARADYEAHRESQKKYRSTERLLGGTIAAVLVSFIFLTYWTVSSRYTLERLAPHLTAELSSLAPEIGDTLVTVAEEVMPVYAELAIPKLEDALPDVEAAFVRELNTIWLNAEDQLRRDFDAALERSTVKLQKRLAKDHPELLTPEGAQVLETELNKLLEEDTSELVAVFVDRYAQDLDKLYNTLEGFRPNRFERLEQEELVMHYIHLWLTLLDYELMGIA
jgi:hypothetical protein